MQWIKKWEELEKLVKKKYEAYCDLVWLKLDHAIYQGGTQIQLSIRKYDFMIGHGPSRYIAINRAIRTIKENKEAKYAFTVFTGRLLFIGKEMGNQKDEKEIKDELRIIEDCAFKPR